MRPSLSELYPAAARFSPLGRAGLVVQIQKKKAVCKDGNRARGEEILMVDRNSIVAVYNTHGEAEDAVKDLQRGGFDMQKLSIVGKEYHTDQHVVGYYNAGDRMKCWGKRGAFWGGLWGLLFGAAFFIVPGLGPVLIAGPLAAWVVGALEGAALVGGLSVIGAGLYSIGIPKNSIVRYESALKADKFLLIAHGTAEEVTKARDIVQATEPAELDTHMAESEGALSAA
jgi:hypothetical protein